MIDKNKLFKSVNKESRYYPFGLVVEDIYLIVKKGEQEHFVQALDNEWKLAFGIVALTMGIAIVDYIYMWIPFVFYIPYYFYNRAQIEKKYCEYKSYSRITFFKSYGKMVYFFLDEKDNHRLSIFCFMTLLFTWGAYMEFIEKNRFGWGVASAIIALLSLMLTILMVVKRYKS